MLRKIRSCGLLLLIFMGTTADPASAADPKTQGIMHSVYGPLSEVFPLSFDEKKFTDPAVRQKVEGALKMLAENAHRLQDHAKGKDKAFQYVADSLARDAKDVFRWYKRGWFNEARFTLHNMTENCISCHSRIKGDRDFPGAKTFVKNIEFKNLPPLEQATLMVMMRQFDEAMTTYEKVFLDPKSDPTLLVSLDSFADYLKVSMRVRDDFKRPQQTIQKLADRKDTPMHVRGLLKSWSTSLGKIDASKDKLSLANARKLIDSGRDLMEFPRDREGLVYFIAASKVLTGYLESNIKKPVDRGEAYYLLGITESLLERSFWLSQQEYYLETAIRTAPGASFAPKAYALLEEQTIVGYTGSGGTLIPEDVQDLLDDLKSLIEKAKGA